MSDKDQRFLDFGSRTIVNYPLAALMIKNMPLDDMERYGRLKDLLPLFLSAISTKVNVLDTQAALVRQNSEMLSSFAHIRGSLYYLAKTLLKNRDHSNKLLQELVSELSYDMLRMGLEEDQEEFLIHRVDTAIDEAMLKMDAGREIATAFIAVNRHLKSITSKQETLVQTFIDSHKESENIPEDTGDDIELF